MGVIFSRITFPSGTTSRARFPNKVGDGLEMLQLGVKRCLILAHCFFVCLPPTIINCAASSFIQKNNVEDEIGGLGDPP